MATTTYSHPSAIAKPIVDLPDGDVLTNDMSGFTFKISGGANTVTLPEPKSGFQAKFLVTAATTGDISIQTPSGHRDTLEGSLIVAGAAITVDAADEINFVSGGNIGDFVEIFSDGTSYYVFGVALASGQITATEI
jgi:hypothetical protein